MFTERMIDTPLPLNCATGPESGPPLLLLHGVTRRWQDFVTLLPALGSRWHVHALDLRGHGRSTRKASAYRIIDYVDDVGAFLAKRSDGPIVIHGHSLGALVAAAAATRWPTLVRAIVLEDPPSINFIRGIHNTPYDVLFSAMRRLAGRDRSIRDVMLELAEVRLPGPTGTLTRMADLRDLTSLRFSARCLQDLDPTVIDVLLGGRWLDGYDYEGMFRGVRCPALLLRADEAYGGMLPRGEADQIAQWIPDCAMVEFPRVGHLVHWLASETTARLVMGFLEAV
jgi:pimeloyl-ACP methyl ester carboxylesterase